MNDLTIQLDRYPTDAKPSISADGDDDVRSILARVCEACAQTARFSVSFAGEDWPVDVETDLLVFLEQLPSVLGAARSRRDFSVDFYEQGLERRLKFEFVTSNYQVCCVPLGNGIAPSATVIITAEYTELLLDQVLQRFIMLLSDFSPNVVYHPSIQFWLEEQRAA